MQERRATRAVELVAAICWFLISGCLLSSSATAQSTPTTVAGANSLQLAVTINGQPTHFISQFSDLGGGHLASKRSELEEVGVKVPGQGAADEVIRLDSLPALGYAYDARLQTVDLKLDDNNRLRKSYSADEGQGPVKAQASNVGAVLNYNLFAATQQQSLTSGQPNFQGANAGLDGRVLSAWGTLSQTAIVGTTLAQQSNLLRLQTAYSYEDDATQTSYRAGDQISGGLTWTRPIRFGGVQIQRSFSMRPDLVAISMPTLTGTAAVPSTVDVYINSVKAYSQQVGAGPFQINDIPMLTGSGTARVVVRDAAGHQTETAAPFFTAPRVLKEGIFDFSIEGGLPRLSYGVLSDDYSEMPVGSASFRRGITDWLTVEGHAEGGGGLANGGAGVVARTGGLGVVSLSGTGSTTGSKSGVQGYASFDTRLDKVTLHAHTQRTFGDYNDLASVTAQMKPSFTYMVGGVPVFAGPIGSLKPPRAIDAVSASLPTIIDTSFVNVAYLHVVPEDTTIKPSQLVSLSYTRPLFHNATIFATTFKDINDSRSAGLYVGVSMTLGKGISASASLAHNKKGDTYSADLAKPLGEENGAIGWSLHEGEGPDAYRYGSASLRTSAARIEGTVRQDATSVRGTAEVEGSLVAMGGKVFASRRIDDAFAVVNVGTPGVKILRENNLVGETDDDGQLLVTNLSSYQRNKIAIDANGLPLNTEIEQTSQTIVPGLRGGIDVKFAVKRDVASAIVIFKGADGKDLAAGASGRLQGASDPFVVGYDGQAFIRGLKPKNVVSITAPSGTCEASFDYVPLEGKQAVVGPVVCQ